MVDRDSGVFAYASAAAEYVENLARVAFTDTDLSPYDPEPAGIVFLRLAGPCCIPQFVDVGVARGDVQLVFDARYDLCVSALFATGQAKPELNMACGRAVARFMSHRSRRPWHELLIKQVALAVIMPEPVFREDMLDLTTIELARTYKVSPLHVLERCRLLRGAYDTAERAALAAAIP